METEKKVFSSDGTTIGYRKMGSGPGLLICHGGARISQNYRKLGYALAKHFTVYIPDRRGRGLSGAAGENYNIDKAREDLTAVIHETQPDFIFGHSAGALIALETMPVPPVEKIALYEPPVSVNGSLPVEWLIDFETALKNKKRKKAMVISLKGLKANEAVVKMPFWVLRLLINVLAFAERKKEKGTRMLDLLDTLPADLKMAMALDSTFKKYNTLQTPVLLMAGSKSPAYFHTGIQALADTLPHATKNILRGFDHYSPEEKVEEITQALKHFFLSNQ